MPASELRKQVDEMKNAFDCVVTAATEPIQKRVDQKFAQLQKEVCDEVRRVATTADLLLSALEQNTESLEELKNANQLLMYELKNKKEEGVVLLLESLSTALEKLQW